MANPRGAWVSAGYLEVPCLRFRHTLGNNCVTDLSLRIFSLKIMPHGNAEVIGADARAVCPKSDTDGTEELTIPETSSLVAMGLTYGKCL